MMGRSAYYFLAVFGLLGLINLPAQAADGCDPIPGQKLFEVRCTACHSLAEHKVGPRLHDVLGRKAGTAEGFSFTPAHSAVS